MQGDVGSGKTVVAIAAMLRSWKPVSRRRSWPDPDLAEQHYAVLSRWLEPLGVRLALRTGARQEESAALPLFQDDASGDFPHIIVGTHALLYEGVSFEIWGWW